LTVYVSADEQIARKVFTAFTDKTGIDVAWVGDTESSKNTSLVQRLIREKDRPVADVFWSSEILGTLQLAQKKVLTPCLVTALEHWPEQYRDSSYTWYGFSPRARVIAFDPNKTSKESLPKFWWEYSNAAMADPRFGTTSTHVAVMAMFPKKSSALFGAMQRKPMIGGNSATVQAVIDGVVPFAMTDSDDVHAAIERGASVDMFMPRHHEDVGGGTLLIPNTVGIVQGSKKIELAESFVTFLLSEEVAILLASSTSHNIPIQPTVAKLFPELVVEDPLVIDFYEALAIQEEQIAAVMDVMTK
jgi:iron(III) transport system substrate-binding protein